MLKLKVSIRALLLLLALATGLSAPAQNAHVPATNLHSLWKVEGKSNVVYLMGSIHLLKPENYPLAKPLEAAFSNSPVVVFETDIGKMQEQATQLKLAARAQLPEGQTLKQQLSAGTYAAFTRHLEENSLPAAAFESFRPAMAGMMITIIELQKLGFDPEQGLDMHYFERARKEDKKIEGLETVDFQIDLVTDFSKEEGEALLKSTLLELDQTKKSFGEVISAWETGDAAKLDKLINEAMREAPAIFKRLLTDRSRSWVPKIEEYLRGNRNVALIVGAGHLVGSEGLVELLKKKGLKVTQQ